ncbi:MAG: hypothetical protein AB1478_09085, partial [Nitrospirota bacterium]
GAIAAKEQFCPYMNKVISDCQGTCTEGKDGRITYACFYFKVYWEERLKQLSNIEDKKESDIKKVMGEKYKELTDWLYSFDLGADEIKETLPELYQDIQDAIERLDSACINEDMPAFQDALENIRLLYIEALFKCRKIAVKIYSESLGCHLWIVETDRDIQSLRSQGKVEPIYTADEIKMLKGVSEDSLREIHKVKGEFPGSLIEELKKQKAKTDENEADEGRTLF